MKNCLGSAESIQIFFLDRSWFELSAAACSLPDNVLLLWTDSEAAACLEKGKHGTQESTCGTLWECLDISPGIPKRRKEEKKNPAEKAGGFQTPTDTQRVQQHNAQGRSYLVFPVWPRLLAVHRERWTLAPGPCQDYLLTGWWMQANREKRTDLGVHCRIQWHLDIKALPVPEQKKKKKITAYIRNFPTNDVRMW